MNSEELAQVLGTTKQCIETRAIGILTTHCMVKGKKQYTCNDCDYRKR